MTVRNLIDEAKKLSPAEKAELLDELMCLIGPEAALVPLTPEQKQDLQQRIAEVRSGKAAIVPGDEAVERMRRRDARL
jgi:putative addiction module component (TIGR02574 family)